MRLPVGKSRWAKARQRKAAELGRLMRQGDKDAAFRLRQRARALYSVAKRRGLFDSVQAMKDGTHAKHQRAKARAAVAAEQRRLAAQLASMDDAAKAAYRAKYGSFVPPPADESLQGKCRAVPPGGVCDVCGWLWGGKEPHSIGVP
jgi:rubrerythrin